MPGKPKKAAAAKERRLTGMVVPVQPPHRFSMANISKPKNMEKAVPRNGCLSPDIRRISTITSMIPATTNANCHPDIKKPPAVLLLKITTND